MNRQIALTVLTLAALAAPALAGSDVQVIVKFKGDASASTVTAKGGTVVGAVASEGAVVATIPPGRIAALRADPSVAYVEEDGICELLGNAGVSKRPSGGGGGSTQPSQTLPWGVDRVLTGAPSATGGSGVKVAVIDTGIDLDHPDLPTVAAGALFVSSRTNTADDDNGHGTHVAGTICARSNSIGVVGVAPGVSLYAAKVLDRRGSGTWSGVANGISWATAQGVNVANLSLGGSSSSSTLQSACNAAASAGVLLIAAAGNEGDGNATTPEISYPAYYGSVVSIGATSSSDAVASFSNTNADVEFAAPGVSVYSTYKGGGYTTLSGTSMASPHAAGVAALHWAALGVSANPTSVVAAMVAAVDPVSGSANAYGAGIVQY